MLIKVTCKCGTDYYKINQDFVTMANEAEGYRYQNTWKRILAQDKDDWGYWSEQGQEYMVVGYKICVNDDCPTNQ